MSKLHDQYRRGVLSGGVDWFKADQPATEEIILMVPQGEVWLFGQQKSEVWTQAKDGVLKGAAVVKRIAPAEE